MRVYITAMYLGLVLLVVVVDVIRGQAPVLCTGQSLGEASPATATPGGNTGGYTYVMLDTSITVPCCGVISQWMYATAAAGDLTAQIWQQSAGNVYEVIGENVISGVTSGQTSTFSVATNDQISVESGFRIGWHSSAGDIVPYEATASGVMGRVSQSGKTATGSTASLPTPLINGEQWQFGAILGPNSVPTFTTLPATVTALTTDAVGKVVHTVTTTDANPDDIAGLTVSMNAASSTLFDLVGNEVRVLSTLTVGSHLVVLEVKDHCEETGTATLTVEVSDTAPNITSLPVAAALLREDVTVATSLHSLGFTDDGPLTSVTCSIASSTPTPAPFIMKYAPTTSDYTIYYQPDSSAPLDYDVKPLYSLDIVCNDGIATSNSREFQVSIEPNEPPVHDITAAGISVSAATTTNGLLVHTVTATDPENDDHTFSMNCSCPFRMSPNGKIHATEDLNDHRTTPYTAYVNVSDAYNTVGPTELIIQITDINTPPTITDPTETLPNIDTVHVFEHTDEGTPNLIGDVIDVFTAQGSDADGDTLTWNMTFYNGQGETLYTYDGTTGVISTMTDLDYEILVADGLQTTTVYVSAFDGREYSERRAMNVIVDDVNETPVFNQGLYAVETTEGTATTTLPCALFDVTDEDNYDTRDYDLDCGGVGAFKIPTDRTSACDAFIVQTEEYDLDSPGAASATVTCTVTVKDKGDLTATTTLEITIHEEDDNWPILDQTSYAYTITNATDPGGTFGNADVTDEDYLAIHRRHTFSTDSSEFGVDSNGVFFSKVDWSNYAVPTSRTFNLRVTDEAGHTDTAPVTVTIDPVYTTTTSTTQATTTSSDDITSFFDDPGNAAWFAFAMILAAAALGLLGYLLYSGIVGGGCKNVGSLFTRRGHMTRRMISRPPPGRAIEMRPARVTRVVERKPVNVPRNVTSPPEQKSSVFDCFKKKPPKPQAKRVDESKGWHLWGQNDFKSMQKGVG